ncbi:hypothetical protein Tco_0877125 [Tanacetum coccineum]|uniref:Uncharacterized protein n=1 Tax=Tanacetum coccineum TaxID=301880 RepID=A0ABQ5BZI8_9ASTR
MYNWETAIVYDDALSSQHVDDGNWKNETSLSEYDYGKYNAISDKDLFSYDIFSANDLKQDKDNGEDKIGIEQSPEDIFIEPLYNVISTVIDTYAHVSNELKETGHDTINKFFHN